MARYRNQYASCAGQGALVELSIRMLAEVIPATERIAHDPGLKAIEDAVCDWLEARGKISPDEKKRLRECRNLRNKIFHANFLTAKQRVQEAGGPVVLGGAMSIPIPEKIEDMLPAMAELRGAELVALSGSKRQIFGWILELGKAGDFSKERACSRRCSRRMTRRCSPRRCRTARDRLRTPSPHAGTLSLHSRLQPVPSAE